MARVGVVALVLAVAAVAAASFSATETPTRVDELCDPRLVAERVVVSCSTAFAAREFRCCDAILSSVPRGGAAVRCICAAGDEDELRFTGVTSTDLLRLYHDCGGALRLHPSETETICEDIEAAHRRKLVAACDATSLAWNIFIQCSEAAANEDDDISPHCCELIKMAGDVKDCLCAAAEDPALFDSPVSLEQLYKMYRTCGGMRRLERCWPLEPASFITPEAPEQIHTPGKTRPPLQPQQSLPKTTTTSSVPPHSTFRELWIGFWDGIGKKVVEFVGFFLLGVGSLALTWIGETWRRKMLARKQLVEAKEKEAEMARHTSDAEALRQVERDAYDARKREREAEAAKERQGAHELEKLRLELELAKLTMVRDEKILRDSDESSSSSGTSSAASSSSPLANTAADTLDDDLGSILESTTSAETAPPVSHE